eukprot:TRINITY_DN3479_c0_g1_i1.p1 TRINITY_DN3479_c0_g1~~TRINITY_DN3479_c0_g1_i1.p1  ORF type:complete len:191 (+),score=42.73 TRINITY_DN3479_c0_g1_i1:74-646(+)
MKFALRIAAISLAALAARVVATQKAPAVANAASIALSIIEHSKACFKQFASDESGYKSCTNQFCERQCGSANAACQGICISHARPLFATFRQEAEKEVSRQAAERVTMLKEASDEQQAAMKELQSVQERMRRLNGKMAARAVEELKHGNAVAGRAEMAKVNQLNALASQIDEHLQKVGTFQNMIPGRQLA